MNETHQTAEVALLGAILLDMPEDYQRIRELVALLSEEDFDDPRHASIFSALMVLLRDGKPLDWITVEDYLNSTGKIESAGGAGYVRNLGCYAATSTQMGSHAAIIQEAGMRRRLGKTLSAAKESAADPEVKPIDALSSARKSLDKCEPTSQAIGVDGAGIAEALRAYLDKKPDNERLIHFGFAPLDDAIHALRPGHFITIGGRPGSGKTTLALNIASNALFNPYANNRVLMVSLEMTHEELGMRLASQRIMADLRLIQSRALPPEVRMRVDMFREEVTASGRFVVVDKPAMTVADIRVIAERMKLMGGLDLLVIDYLQLIGIPAEDRKENRATQIAGVTRELKILARELCVPIVVPAQVNRSSDKEDRPPRLSDLRESGSIEQDSDVVILIDRPELRNPGDPKLVGIATAAVAKQRNGPTGEVGLRFEGQFCRFAEPFTP